MESEPKLIEAYKQEDGAYSNPENGWISGFIEDLKSLVEEQKYYVLFGNQPHDDNWTYALTMAQQNGLALEECLETAYNEIADRKGKMVNGVFVKEEDL